MPPPPPRALPDELLLRLPPDDPGCLVRASLVCKPWRSRLTGSSFPRRYREFHGTPPLLGFFENDEKVCCWIAPLSPTSPVLPVYPGRQDLFALDSRHGLVLLNGTGEETLMDLLVWDPVRHRQWELPFPEFLDSYNAAVLCAVDGCDHLDCRGDSFLVVYVGADEDEVAHACVYSSEDHAWGPVTSCEHPGFSLEVIAPWPKALVGDSVYFLCTSRTIILRYDLLSHELSVITSPAMCKWEQDNRVLMGMEDGVLGCATLQESRLELWAMEFRTDGTVEWELRRVIELQNWLPSRSSYVINFADGVGIFFVRTNIGIFTVELKSGRVKKISRRNDQVIPYMRFYTPDQSGGITPTSTMASSENVEAAQYKHHDLLLPHSSGEVGDDKEKWVENGEEDSEWEKGEGSERDWKWQRKKAAQDLFEDGSEAIEEGEFRRAQSFFSDALDYMLGLLPSTCPSYSKAWLCIGIFICA